MRLFIVGLFTAALAACGGGHSNVQCQQDSNCDLSGGGKCVAAPTGNQWCAYPDPGCSSGYRFSDQDVGDNVGGTCVAGNGSNTIKYTLTVALGGSGKGTVTTDPAGLTCTGNTCTAMFDQGTVVNLTEMASMGQFLGWSDACSGTTGCAVTMDHDQTVGALFGTPGALLWAKQFGSANRDVGHSIVLDGNGDLIAVGEFSGTITFGTTMLTSAGGTDIYVVKLASDTGTVVWAKKFGGASNDVANDVAVDDTNNVYVAGSFMGSVDFGGGALQAGAQSSGFALKLATDGTFGWARKFGGNQAQVMTIAARGNSAVVAGWFSDTFTVDSTTLTYTGATDIFVISMATASGTSNWIKSFGGGSYGTMVRDSAIDGSGNVDLVGWFAGTINFGGGAMSTPGNLNDVLLLKVSGTDGSHLLSSHYGGPDAHDYGYGISVDGSNNIYITGQFGGTGASFGCANTFNASQANVHDVFVAKYTQAGSCTWAKGFGGSCTFDRQGYGVSADASGDVAIVGSFCGTITFGGAMLTAAGTGSALDVYAARFSTDGTHLNSARVGGTGSEYGFGVAQNANGRFYATGSFTGFADFGGTAFTSAGDNDAFVMGLEAL